MRIRETIEDHVAVLTLEGNFLCLPSSGSLRDRIQALLTDGIKCVVIDLGEVTCVNSEGLGVLIASLATLKRSGVELRLANASDIVDNLLLLTQLTKVFSTHDTVGQAVAAYKPKPT